MESNTQIDPQLIKMEGVRRIVKGTGDALNLDQQKINVQGGGEEESRQQDLIHTVFHQDDLL